MCSSDLLLADEMGLGKTIQAIGLINACPDILTVLIVCPASLKNNWKRELERWLTVPMEIAVVSASTDVLPKANVLIVNYDLLHRFIWAPVDLLVLDEAHYCKNPLARRTKKALALRADRKLFMTGTAILSRPIEVYPLVKALDPKNWPSRHAFGMRYCAGFMGDWGADFSGASHLDELHDRLRTTIMLRRQKAEVLKDLPAKTRQIIELPADSRVLLREKRIRGVLETAALLSTSTNAEYAQRVKALSRAKQEAFENLAVVRHETALAKVPQVIDFVTEVLESTTKVVLFAHHRDVIENLAVGLSAFQPVVLTGNTPINERQKLVDKFQNDPTCRLFIGNIQAAGVGITLTAASHVIFAELDWVPGNMSQAEDRCHRIGQRDSVLVQHLVLEGSLDASIARALVDKQAVLDQALDGIAPPTEAPIEDLIQAFQPTNQGEKSGTDRTSRHRRRAHRRRVGATGSAR